MARVRTTEWKDARGVRRRIRLYKAWIVAGVIKDGSGNAIWKGLPVEWKSWEEFRAWSLANGFSRINNSLDRKRTSEGYGPNNCQWIPAVENSRLSVYNMHAKNAARRAACAA